MYVGYTVLWLPNFDCTIVLSYPMYMYGGTLLAWFMCICTPRAGYKEPEVTIDSKREQLKDKAGEDEGDDKVREDELPTVVALQEGDISESEYREFLEKIEKLKKENGKYCKYIIIVYYTL